MAGPPILSRHLMLDAKGRPQAVGANNEGQFAELLSF